MKNANKCLRIIALALVFIATAMACFAQSGGGTINSAAALNEYLDSQPVNGPDKPIQVSMSANDPMIKDIAKAIQDAGKYVSLTLAGNALKTIPDKVFYKCECLVEIIIPDSVASIGNSAFSYCTSLTSVTIGKSVTSIGDSAFERCTSLTSVIIPDSITSIGMVAFRYCSSLTSVSIGNSVTSIGVSAFDDCNRLANVTIPASVTSIGLYAFLCSSLTSVTFQGRIASGNLGGYGIGSNGGIATRMFLSPFRGDLRDKYLAGGPGTYTTSNPGSKAVWTKR
jgi:hypothetical protein